VAFSVLKYADPVYLVYLSVRALLSKEEFVSAEGEVHTPRLRSFFLRGLTSLTMNLLNPKVAVFFFSTLR
jgi:threonine/homoserine/homoserine lactone efflux protein